MAAPPLGADGNAFPDDIETETLLAQGDELIRSSRDLLDQLDEVLPPAADGG